MFALHLIYLDLAGPVFLGKGGAGEETIRKRLADDKVAYQVWIGPQIAEYDELAFRYLLAVDQLRGDGRHEMPQTGWWDMRVRDGQLHVHAAMHSMSDYQRTAVPTATMLSGFRADLGFDQATMAAMIGLSRSRLCRMEKGKSDLTVHEFKRLEWWAARLGRTPEFERRFDFSALRNTPIGGPGLSDGGRESA